jgi:branched-subunit amino acid transport protein
MKPSLRSREGSCIVALAVLAALRVLLFSAAFPFFTNVDEHRHVDAVLKYAGGYLPRPENSGYEPEMARYLGIFGSPEYHFREGAEGAREVPPPPWRRSSGEMLRSIEWGEKFLAKRTNLESMQPPAYYAMAGLWLRLGRALGIQGGNLLYWVRGLGPLLVFALVISSYLFLREIYPDDTFMRLGVPLLVSVFPTDVFFYVTRDALSPLVAGIGFFLALRIVTRPTAGFGAHVLVAAVMGLAFLSKYTNVALLGVCGLCTLIAVARRPGAREIRGEGGRLLAMWALIAAPVGAWLVRNLFVFGDLTGTAYKIERMGWGRKPLSEYGDHPIFTLSGLHTFIGKLIPLFWRGELVWHQAPLASPTADGFYIATTLLFVALAALGLRRRMAAGPARLAEGMSLATVLASVVLLAGLSLMYVFHEKSNPPAHLPYFVQGRLISGVLLPFLVIYTRGIEVATSRLPPRAAPAAAWACLALIACVAVVSEVSLQWAVFRSEYNLFHLP